MLKVSFKPVIETRVEAKLSRLVNVSNVALVTAAVLGVMVYMLEKKP